MSEYRTGDTEVIHNFEGVPSNGESEVSTEEKNRVLGEVCIFENEFVPLVDEFLSGDDEVWSDIIEYLRKLDYLSTKEYIKLSEGEKNSQFRHDLNNFSTPVSGYRELLLTNGDISQDKKKKYVKRLRNSGLTYSFIMESLLSRDSSGDIRTDTKKRPMNLDNIIDALLSAGSNVNKKTNFRLPEKPLLKEDEEILTLPGEIVADIVNMLKNSCRYRTGADEVKFEIDRVGDEIVFLVGDNGIGMRRQHLEKDYVVGYGETEEDLPFEDKTDSGYIFEKGEKSSGANSTGLGLAQLDKRIASLDGTLRVASKRKFKTGKQGEQINFTTETDEKKLPNIELEKGQSTIFEIRLPITKKQK